MSLAGLEMSFEEFEAEFPDIFTLNEPVARLVAALKRQGYTLLLGSNTNVLHARFYRRKFHETLAHFDHLVFSYEVGEMKPELAFFEACLGAVGGAGGLVRLHRRCPRERRGGPRRGVAGHPLSRHPGPDQRAKATGRRGPSSRGMTPPREKRISAGRRRWRRGNRDHRPVVTIRKTAGGCTSKASAPSAEA